MQIVSDFRSFTQRKFKRAILQRFFVLFIQPFFILFVYPLFLIVFFLHFLVKSSTDIIHMQSPFGASNFLSFQICMLNYASLCSSESAPISASKAKTCIQSIIVINLRVLISAFHFVLYNSSCYIIQMFDIKQNLLTDVCMDKLNF